MTGQVPRGAKPATLLVCERDGPSFEPGVPVLRLEYKFVEDYPADGFSAWHAAQDHATPLIEVAETARDFDQPFLRQGLNRLVAQAILRDRVSVILVSGLWGCTVDLPRIASLLGVRSVFIFHGENLDRVRSNPVTQAWLSDALERCHVVCAQVPTDGLREMAGERFLESSDKLRERLREILASPGEALRFDYGTYEFALRDHPLLSRMQAADVEYFRGCTHVLDVACGAGIFLDRLRQEGIRATGVERDIRIAAYGTGLGLDIVNKDAMSYLESGPHGYDGVYCSHFVEHLSVEALQRLLGLLYRALAPGGLAVLVFPDPESIRSQLLGFWRDPEHVRFYHPDLVIAMATVAGFSIEGTNYDVQPHRVIPFEETPPPLPPPGAVPAPPEGDWAAGRAPRPSRWFGRGARREALEQQAAWRRWAGEVQRAFREQQAYLEGLTARTDTLWKINATWSWHDNATIRLRRPASPSATE